MWRGLTDVARGFMVCTSMAQMEQILCYMHSQPHVQLLRIKNRFETPTVSGYSDLLVDMRLTLSAGVTHIVELQLHMDSIKHLDGGHQA